MRLYNGCPDSELQAKLDDDKLAGNQLAKIGLRATYFPMEQKWMAFDCDSLAVSEFYDTKRQLADAMLFKYK